MVLVSSASENTAPTQQTLEISPPADLDKTTTELANWLALIDQMLKSNIVTVGNTEEINQTIARMKVCVLKLLLFQIFFKSTAMSLLSVK